MLLRNALADIEEEFTSPRYITALYNKVEYSEVRYIRSNYFLEGWTKTYLLRVKPRLPVDANITAVHLQLTEAVNAFRNCFDNKVRIHIGLHSLKRKASHKLKFRGKFVDGFQVKGKEEVVYTFNKLLRRMLENSKKDFYLLVELYVNEEAGISFNAQKGDSDDTKEPQLIVDYKLQAMN